MKQAQYLCQTILGLIGGGLGWFFGRFDGFWYALVVLAAVDYLTGVLRAIFEKMQIASLNGHLCHIWRPACDLNGGQPRTH